MASLRTLGSVLEELLNADDQEPLVLDDNVALIDGMPVLDDESLSAWISIERQMTVDALEMGRES
jgi:hypothetical protein